MRMSHSVALYVHYLAWYLERSLNCTQSSQSSALKLQEDTEISSHA